MNAAAFWAKNDRTVHLGQLAQSCGGELDVEREPSATDGLDVFVVAEDDQPTSTSAKDALEAVAQRRAWRDSRQRHEQLGVRLGGRPHVGRGHRLLSSGCGWAARVYPCATASSATANALCTSPTAVRCKPSGTGPWYVGVTTCSNPSLAASMRRRSDPGTARTSPASPISPNATSPGGSGRSTQALPIDMASARSEAGSRSCTPPTVAA